MEEEEVPQSKEEGLGSPPEREEEEEAAPAPPPPLPPRPHANPPDPPRAKPRKAPVRWEDARPPAPPPRQRAPEVAVVLQPPPRPPSRQRSASLRLLLIASAGLALVLLPAALIGFGPAALSSWAELLLRWQRPAPALVLYPLAERLSAEFCIRPTQDEIRSGRVMRGKVQLADVRASLEYHMRTRKKSGLCAQHLGVPLCFCIFDVSAVSPSGIDRCKAGRCPEPMSDPLYLYNPILTGRSMTRFVLSHEKNSFCKHDYYAKRHESVMAAYLDQDGNAQEVLFNGTHSIQMQHVAEIHRGSVTCADNKIDLVARMLKERLEDKDARDMLYGRAEPPEPEESLLVDQRDPPRLLGTPHRH